MTASYDDDERLRRWRLVLPWPQNESNLDLIELVPA